jgi:hypothetical protein
MTDWFTLVKTWIYRLVELGLALIALGVIVQILFGNTPFLGADIVGNLTGLIGALGENGLVGLIALAVILWLFIKKP